MSKESLEKEAKKERGKPLRYSTERFLYDSLEPEAGRDRFDIVGKRLVRIEVDGFVWIKRGSVIAYRGDLKFTRERVLQTEGIHIKSGPLRTALKREIVPLARATGKGVLYITDNGFHNQIVHLDGGTIYVLSSALLAFEPNMEFEYRMVGGVGVLAGGLFVVKLTGNGLVAFSVKGDPLTMMVAPDSPVSADPIAVLAWTGGLWPELKTDLEARTLVAHGGGTAIQMLFRGEGYVVVNARSIVDAFRTGIFKKIGPKIKGILFR